MSLNNLIKRAKAKSEVDNLPDWVSEKNITFAAYKYINELKNLKLDFIGKHNKVIEYKTKKSYQITASEVARHIKVATPTLISTSVYSTALRSYLESVNKELLTAKELKLQSHKKTLAAGTKQRKKDEIVTELLITRKELDDLKKKNALQQATFILEKLALPIKQKLGLDI